MLAYIPPIRVVILYNGRFVSLEQSIAGSLQKATNPEHEALSKVVNCSVVGTPEIKQFCVTGLNTPGALPQTDLT
jgi:hypothetical protein